jgi:hypothetical protein
MEQFEDLASWDLLVESRQYRNLAAVKNLSLKTVTDFAFLDLVGLFVLYNEYETAPVASRYADKTMSFRNFSKARLSGTDLYVSMNILSDPTSVFTGKIAQNPEADAILRSKQKIHLPSVKRYLDLIADAKITPADASVLLLRLEKQLNITDPKLKAIRRLAQDWPGLNQMQRSLVVERMLQFYRRYAKRSELAVFLEDLGKSKGYEIRGAIDAELKNLGYGEPVAQGSSKLASTLAPAAAFYAGYKLMRMFGPKMDK